MGKSILYHGSITVCGGILGFRGLNSVISGEVSLVPILLSISGIAMVFSAVSEAVLSSNSSGSIPDDRIVWSTVVLTLIAVIAGMWSVIA
ncbi:hypothetical protein [Haloquadratum walsbyi]|uniref:Uncharacterized protein n=1 Tax=Haloquadratum walsbyi J07HQW2 TaxID=1238425 RepID=U1NA87_9EURY|nr:hypothetical protein [Haloquadratum walsbyi]ERG93740.1 MAG: hypothetical protein J07HQW2_00174 [Haloquadratum walsbyi J07HQW2]